MQDLKVTGVSETTVSMSWNEPADDGGSEVTDYIIEKREASKRSWSKVTSVEDEEICVKNLVEGTQYMFHVAAKNEVGVGEFVELGQSVTAKSPHGMWR